MRGDNTARKLQPLGPDMSTAQFRRLRDLIYVECGIQLDDDKKGLLVARLQKRVKALGMKSYREYHEYLDSSKGRQEEFTTMIDAVTTNKTEFFREPWHLDYLTNVVLPALVPADNMTERRKVNVWSAGCSSGEEPYSLAMVVAEYLGGVWGGSYSILATDISTRMLATAKRAVYSDASTGAIPEKIKKKYLLRGKGSQAGFGRIVPELRSHVVFRSLNLTDPNFRIESKMDVIFCRNVMIYFDYETRADIFRKFLAQLVPGGYLCLGHSEALHSVDEEFQRVAPTMYRKNPGAGES